jgi:autotransporter-associated beta strand protein
MLKQVGLFCVACLATAAAVESLSRAETYTVPAGQTQTESTAIKTGNVTVTGGGTLNLTNKDNNYRGGTYVIDGSTVTASVNHDLGGGGGRLNLGDATTGGTVDMSSSTKAFTSLRRIVLGAGGGTIIGSDEIWTQGGVVQGAGALTVGGGTVTLTGINTYTGGTVIDGGGTLEIAADNRLGAAGSGITLGDANTAGTIDFTNSRAVTTTRGITVNPGGGTIEMGASPKTEWTFTGPLAGTGPLAIDGKGTLVLGATGTYSGLATIDSGTFQIGSDKTPDIDIPGGVTLAGGTLAGFGSIGGTVTNDAGTVSPGAGKSAGTLTVNNYTQGADGTLALNLRPKNGSLLVVDNAADLDGTLKLNFKGYFRSTTLQLVDAGSVNGSFANVTGTLSASMQQQVVYTPSGVELVLTQLPTLPDNPTIYTAMTSAAIDAAQGANDMFLGHITDMLNGAAVDGMQMSLTGDHAAGYSAGETMYGTWAQGYGGVGSASGGNGAPGYNVSGGGFATGIDSQLTRPGVFGGIGVDGSYDSVGEKGGASGHVLSPRVMVYGGWWHDWLAIDGTLGLGDGMFDTRRPIAGASSTSSASYQGYEVTGALQANTNLHLGALVITPALGAEYAMLSTQSAVETGGPYDVNAKGAMTNSMRPFAAATASTRLHLGENNLAIEPRLRVAIEAEALSTARRVTVEPVGDAQDFVIDGVSEGRETVNASAGVMVETNRDFGVFSDVGVIYSRNSEAASLDAGVRYRF